MTPVQRIELSLKIIVALVAVFGVWKFFADRATEKQIAAEERALSYIERFGHHDFVMARTKLLSFWKDYPQFVSVINKRAVTDREYNNFINIAYPIREDRADIDAALFSIQLFLDEVVYCRWSAVCDVTIVDGFFCDFVQGVSRVYAPFYARLSEDIASQPLDAEIRRFAASCRSSKR